ncbi:MAG: hypothetical protein JSS66_11030 [Armatimonadetes bacterium]|nr:hypothetical protein [Armatimonadota bacterium]
MANPLLYGHPFVAGGDPWCVWDYEIKKHNLAFLESIDPGYFDHFAKVHGRLLESEERQYAAVALRAAYTHGLESLFALICATMQAPEEIVAWMLKYKPSAMQGLVQKISKGEPFLRDLDILPMTWENIAAHMLTFQTSNPEKDGRIKSGFGRLWRRLADDVLDQSQTAEYNSIKHGLRVRMGGFHLAMGAEETPGVPAPPENMRLLGRSDFGSSFYEAEALGGANFRVKKHSVNWSPTKFVVALQLIAMSINNVVSYAKTLNGVAPGSVHFSWPQDEAMFDEPWRHRPTIGSFNMNSIIEKDMIQPLTKEEILKAYQQSPLQGGTIL